MLSNIWYLLLPCTFFPFTIRSRASFSRQFLLCQWPANFFSSSLSVPALFFLLTLFTAQLHFLFYLSILHAPSFSISTYQMLPVIFAHFVVVSKSLHHTTLHYTQSTSLASSLVLFPRVCWKCFSFLPLLSSALLLDSSSGCYWYSIYIYIYISVGIINYQVFLNYIHIFSSYNWVKLSKINLWVKIN